MEKKNGRRVILFPLPLQGCINPMLQLSNILFSKGFSVTVIHTRFNAPNPQNFLHFTFLQIPDGLTDTQVKEAPTGDVMSLLVLINRNSESPFRELLAKLLKSEKEDERICCLIDDCGWLFTKSVADSFGLPRIVLSTYEATFLNAYPILPSLRRKGYLRIQESEAEDPVPEFPPLQKKDLLRIRTEDEEPLDQILVATVETMKRSSGIIFMSCLELEQDSLIRSFEVFQVPIFPIGPFHSYFMASTSSLLTQDETCIPWLDKQEEESVIYVSLGSVVTISESEFLEIAWGLSSCYRPFLWVVRPGSVRGAEWIERLPQGFMEDLNRRGKIVKWAPQQEVLAHRATGGFLTHNGWNSTLESICEGVPMICLPRGWDQMLNARLVSNVWRVGLHLEGRIERNEIERAVRRLMIEPEGREIRNRTKQFKDRVGKSIERGGSSYRSLENLVDHILSL